MTRPGRGAGDRAEYKAGQPGPNEVLGARLLRAARGVETCAAAWRGAARRGVSKRALRRLLGPALSVQASLREKLGVRPLRRCGPPPIPQPRSPPRSPHEARVAPPTRAVLLQLDRVGARGEQVENRTPLARLGPPRRGRAGGRGRAGQRRAGSLRVTSTSVSSTPPPYGDVARGREAAAGARRRPRSADSSAGSYPHNLRGPVEPFAAHRTHGRRAHTPERRAALRVGNLSPQVAAARRRGGTRSQNSAAFGAEGIYVHRDAT